MLDYDLKRLVERVSTEMSQAISQIGNRPVQYPPPIDLSPVADAIREGFTSIATAIEYVGQLEDQRYRDRNKQEETVMKTKDGEYKLFRNPSGFGE